jgi:plasmid stabilization system protein ParE
MRVVWTSIALERAQEIRELIALDRPQAATRWLDELEQIVRSLDRFPRRGRVVPEFSDPDIREIQHQPYRIIYEIRGDLVAILTIRHGRQIID